MKVLNRYQKIRCVFSIPDFIHFMTDHSSAFIYQGFQICSDCQYLVKVAFFSELRKNCKGLRFKVNRIRLIKSIRAEFNIFVKNQILAK
jgi:hypothetical protein